MPLIRVPARCASALLSALSALSVLSVLSVLAAGPALAHDSLKSSSPAKDAVVSGLERIELEFSARVNFPVVVLRDAAGRRFESGAPRVEGPKVVQDVAGPLPSGGYTIAWRVVSSDGHPVEGEIPFTVQAAEPDGAAEPAAAPSAGPVTAPAATPSDAAAAAGAEPEAAAPAAPAGVPAWVWAAAALAAVTATVAVLGRRRVRGDGRRDDSGPGRA